MKILHLCLSCFYIDGYNYQENVLPRINREDGHEVRIIASTETYVDNQHLGYVEPSEYVTEYGVPIKRLPYVKVGGQFTTVKFRKYPHLYEEIAAFDPDVILSHGLTFWSVRDVIRYKQDHPAVKLYADTHTDAYTSGTNWLSLHVLHRVFYRRLVQKALPYLEKYLCITDESRVFSMEHYGVPEALTEFYPLGGTIPTEAEYAGQRETRRAELGVREDELLLVHAGKLEPQKKTDALLRAFAAVPELKAKLAVIGSIPEETKASLLAQMDADPRVMYLGWKSGVELLDYLCAADLYCQPGKVSAIMQNAVCCRCPILLYPHPGYVKDYDYGNLLWVKTEADMAEALRRIAAGETDLAALEQGSQRCARELLDYRALAARLYR